MPTYEYKCSKCKQEVEVIHGINSERPSKHQSCGGRLSAIISAPTIVYKGKGWARKTGA